MDLREACHRSIFPSSLKFVDERLLGRIRHIVRKLAGDRPKTGVSANLLKAESGTDSLICAFASARYITFCAPDSSETPPITVPRHDDGIVFADSQGTNGGAVRRMATLKASYAARLRCTSVGDSGEPRMYASVSAQNFMMSPSTNAPGSEEGAGGSSCSRARVPESNAATSERTFGRLREIKTCK